MNDKGEITLLVAFFLLILMSIVLLSALELRGYYLQLQKRTHLFLCTKEAKGELDELLTFIGQTNWGIRHINKATLLGAFIPGLQGMALKTQKLKKYLQKIQGLKVLSFLKSMNSLRLRQCPLDTRLFQTPFKLGKSFLVRDSQGAVKLREETWSYLFYSSPYLLQLKVKPESWESPRPRIGYKSSEKKVMSSFRLSSF